MDPPKTRRESKKTDKEKKADVYSAKHARLQEQALANSKNKSKSNK